jgi:membrane protein
MTNFFKLVLKILIDSFNSWLVHRGASKGAALAFYSLFSIAPILILAIAIAGYFYGAEAAQGQILSEIQKLVGKNGAVAIQAILAASSQEKSGYFATLWAILFLIIGATSVFTELKSSLDELWGIQKKDLSAFNILLRTRLLSFGLVLVLAFLLLVSLVVSTMLSVFSEYAWSLFGNTVPFISILTTAISFLVITTLFAIIYKMLPDAPLSWADVFIGSVVTACLFTLGKHLIEIYLGESAVASGFGASGSIIAMLLWIYYSAQIFFLGAEFTRQYAINYGSLKNYRTQQNNLDELIAKPLETL